MKNIIMVSKCVSITAMTEIENRYKFHFKGIFAGDLLKSIILRGNKGTSIKRGEEYLVYIRINRIEDGVLYGEILKIKPLDDCWDHKQ